MLVLNYIDYKPLHWHGTLLYWMVILLSTLVNILGVRVFPHIETVAFLFHICFFFVLLVPFWFISRLKVVINLSLPISSDAFSWMLGLLTSAWCFVGTDHHSNSGIHITPAD